VLLLFQTHQFLLLHEVEQTCLLEVGLRFFCQSSFATLTASGLGTTEADHGNSIEGCLSRLPSFDGLCLGRPIHLFRFWLRLASNSIHVVKNGEGE
jgi:hypothetical protein